MKGKILLDIFSILDQQLSLGCPKGRVLSLSTCEAKYVAASSFVWEAIWLKILLNEFDHPQKESIIIYVDNKSALELSKNPV